MEVEEILEMKETGLQRTVGVTMAIFAALLAVVTLMGHRLHTEEVVLQTKLADQWAFYQAKNTRSQIYAADAKLAELQGARGVEVAAGWVQKAAEERKQADDIRHNNEELDGETQATARKATLFDSAEVFLEIAIVLCSIALLTGNLGFWRASFAGTAIAVVLAALACLR